MYGNATTKTETYGSGASAVVRATSATTDGAGRATASAITVTPSSAGGTVLPNVHYGYDAATGLPTTKSTTSGSTTTTVTAGYDTLGQQTSYTDATSNTSTVGYDLDGRPISSNDGKGTTTYTYDSSTDHRSVITSANIGVSASPATFAATYDAAGNMASETYPSGLVAARSFDNAGSVTSLAYSQGATTWLGFDQAENAQGQIVTQNSVLSHQKLVYDESDRLVTVQDTATDLASGDELCATRVYGFNDASDRLSLTSFPDDGNDPANGSCSTATTAVTTNSAYDQADRINPTSYTYDALGRTISVPATDAHGTGAHAGTTGPVTVGYYANDIVAAESQGSETQTFTLDPNQDRVAQYTTAGGTTTNHYSDDTDSPTWTQKSTNAWSRNILGPDGNLAGNTDENGTVTLNLTNLHGDVVASAADAVSANGPSSYNESNEYGVALDSPGAHVPYGWLGSKQRSVDDLGGLTLMGVRLYNSASGRFLSTDPIADGNANAYTYPTNPISEDDTTGQDGGCLVPGCRLHIGGGSNPCGKHPKKSCVSLIKTTGGGKCRIACWVFLAALIAPFAAACLATTACAAIGATLARAASQSEVTSLIGRVGGQIGHLVAHLPWTTIERVFLKDYHAIGNQIARWLGRK